MERTEIRKDTLDRLVDNLTNCRVRSRQWQLIGSIGREWKENIPTKRAVQRRGTKRGRMSLFPLSFLSCFQKTRGKIYHSCIEPKRDSSRVLAHARVTNDFLNYRNSVHAWDKSFIASQDGACFCKLVSVQE